MDNAMNVGLKEEIIAELTVELQNQPTFNDEILAIKVRDAYRKVRSRKCYQSTSYTEEQIEKDLYDSENNISRTWRTEDEIMGNIVAYVGIL